MSKSRKILYGIAAFAVFALGVNVPGFIDAGKQKKAVEATFSAYSRALVSEDYAKAYELCGEEFKRTILLESFVATQHETQSNFGKLKTMDNADTYLHGKGSPMRWISVIEAHQVYEKGNVRLVCEFHLENDSWKLFGCKQV